LVSAAYLFIAKPLEKRKTLSRFEAIQRVLHYGRVGVVEGSYSNFKITTYEDFLFASRLIEQQRRTDGDRW